jgi:predicted component of type VI protein secretion system
VISGRDLIRRCRPSPTWPSARGVADNQTADAEPEHHPPLRKCHRHPQGSTTMRGQRSRPGALPAGRDHQVTRGGGPTVESTAQKRSRSVLGSQPESRRPSTGFRHSSKVRPVWRPRPTDQTGDRDLDSILSRRNGTREEEYKEFAGECAGRRHRHDGDGCGDPEQLRGVRPAARADARRRSF